MTVHDYQREWAFQSALKRAAALRAAGFKVKVMPNGTLVLGD